MHVLLGKEKLNVAKHDVKLIPKGINEMEVVIATCTTGDMVVDKEVWNGISKGWRWWWCGMSVVQYPIR